MGSSRLATVIVGIITILTPTPITANAAVTRQAATPSTPICVPVAAIPADAGTAPDTIIARGDTLSTLRAPTPHPLPVHGPERRRAEVPAGEQRERPDPEGERPVPQQPQIQQASPNSSRANPGGGNTSPRTSRWGTASARGASGTSSRAASPDARAPTGRLTRKIQCQDGQPDQCHRPPEPPPVGRREHHRHADRHQQPAPEDGPHDQPARLRDARPEPTPYAFTPL
ncbi:hypothetical protein IAG44_08315 [Streptomyces roseirectus]|uniref:Secreted protein n=1 Tax=Streptomyces roseirectus TaxID=2768066 RepID=A0A7H0I9H8_9ACTN|nr:hypothetical protein [Streptomyces roseirectus]QNP69444.1 hypothetical protein IAG44_08315 [Streptomyces roseirectus]